MEHRVSVLLACRSCYAWKTFLFLVNYLYSFCQVHGFSGFEMMS